MYASVDKWKPGKELAAPDSDNVLDVWMLARLQRAINELTTHADAYDLPKAMKVLADLLDDTSNWFVRRSRRRFWKSEDDGDKANAYATLHYTLVRLTQLFAPWAPFVTDELWRPLTKGMDLPASVHLSDWPEAHKETAAQLHTIVTMHKVREIITEGLSQRATAKVKVRQPLANVIVPTVAADYADILAEELNVKKVVFKGDDVVLDLTLTDDLRAEGAMRDIVRHIQNLRKTSGLNVDDRIVLHIESADLLMQRAVKEFGDVIAQETLATQLSPSQQEFAATAKIDGVEVDLSLSKA
jgi:isoleucyl-tRNA synthetase